jgi:hypothetical protein
MEWVQCDEIKSQCTYNDEQLENAGRRQEVPAGCEAPPDFHIVERRGAPLMLLLEGG